MLLTERPKTDFDGSSAPTRDVQLRFVGGLRDREIIHLTPGNHSVGSGPKCSVRLRDAGVGPMHCLIVRDDAGVRVRRWSSDTLLNGQPFSEAPLVGGDQLSIGPIDLEMVGPARDEIVLPMVEPVIDLAYEDMPDELDEVNEFEAPTSDWSYDGNEPADDLTEMDEEGPSVSARQVDAPSGGIESPGIGVQILSALETQRAQFDELLSRVDDLEQKVELALVEGNEAAERISESTQENDLTALAADFEQSYWLPSEPSLESKQDRKSGEELAWVNERSSLVARSANLEADLTRAQQQLAAGLTELAEARATINSLQSKLADSLRAWQELSDERAGWQQQLDEFESHLAAHAARVEELENQLHQSQLRAEEAIAAATAPAELSETAVEPAEVDYHFGDETERDVVDEAAAELDWTTPAIQSETAAEDQGYDWSAKPADEIADFDGSATVEEAAAADEHAPNQSPWTFQDSVDVTADDSAEASR